jgi:NADPH-dependent ferric siderophore reductase
MNADQLGATRRPVPDTLFGGRLKEAYLLDLEVAHVEAVAPHVRSITLASRDLLDFEYVAGQDLMIEFPDGARSVRRRYTIRRADASKGTADLEFEIHGDGVAARWAAEAEEGQALSAIGPRGAIAVRPEFHTHLFVVDDSAVPAAFAMIEALPSGATARTVVVTPHGAFSRPTTLAASETLRWAKPDDLGSTLSDLELPAEIVSYVFGERRLVAETTDFLVSVGLERGNISSKAYWRRDQPNASHGEPAR